MIQNQDKLGKIGIKNIESSDDKEDGGSSSSDSNSENYLEFNSDDDEADVIQKIQKKLAGSKRKSQNEEIDLKPVKRPLIEDITD